MIIHAHGGLANRLRVVLSYRAAHGPIVCVWKPDSQVAGSRFTDCFSPLDGVEFIDDGKYNVSSCDPSPHAPSGWQKAYGDLVLRPQHEATVNALECPIAVHIRRTDIADLGVALEPEDDYIRFIQDHEGPAFLATDNYVTQHYMHGILGERVVRQRIEEHGELPHDHRATSLPQAAIDMFTCARAKYFKGTTASAFSWAIEILRSLR